MTKTYQKIYTDFFLRGTSVFYRGYDEFGHREHYKHEFEPSIYIPTSAKREGNGVEPDARTLEGIPLAKCVYEDVRDAKAAANEYRGMGVEVYGSPRFEYGVINEMYKSPDIDMFKSVSLLQTGFFDIETESGGDRGFPDIATAPHPINAITLGTKDKLYTLGIEGYEGSKYIGPNDVCEGVEYIACENEKAMLLKFVELWREFDFDIISGWNSKLFDIPYTYNRISKVFNEKLAKTLSPWNIAKVSMGRNDFGGESMMVDIKGIQALDYIELYKKFTYTMLESYKLDYVAHVELGVGKVDYSEQGSLRDLYENDYRTYLEYNAVDVIRLLQIEEKKKLVNLAAFIAYYAKVNYIDTFRNVRVWDVIISNYMTNMGQEVPFHIPVSDDEGGYAGGYVKDPLRGKYPWTASFDLRALYPSKIMQSNISPETYIGNTAELLGFVITPNDFVNSTPNFIKASKYAKEHDYSLCGGGALFDNNDGIPAMLPKKTREVFSQRKAVKDKMLEIQQQIERGEGDIEQLKSLVDSLDNMQLGLKVLGNSLYGAIGSQYFRFYSKEMATSITLSGQATIRLAADKINQYLAGAIGIQKDRIVAGDTDSIYVDLTDVIDMASKGRPVMDTDTIVNAIDKFCSTKLQDQLNECFHDLHVQTNSFCNEMYMKREAIGSAIFVMKKRYIMAVYDNEGVRYAEPKLKVMGLEAVRSTTPGFFRDHMKRIYGMMLTGSEQEVQDEFVKIRNEYNSSTLYDVSSSIGVKGLDKYRCDGIMFNSRTPRHVKGAIAFNYMLEEAGITDKYEAIKSGDKARMLPLKAINPVGRHVNAICFLTVLPEEFELNKYIDLDGHFDALFKQPIQRVLDIVGWQFEVTEVDIFAELF